MTTEHRHSPWRAVLTLILAMAVVAGLIVGVRALVTRGSSPDPGPSPAPTSESPSPSGSSSSSPTPTGPVQQTLLMQVRGDDGLAVCSTLVGDERGSQHVVFVGAQPRLLVDVPGAGQTVLELTSAGSAAAVSQESLSTMLGVRIDATWTLDRLAFAGLVDSIGGIFLDVPRMTVIRGPDGAVLLTLKPGIQRIDGTAAALYAMVRQKGEPESGRMARCQEAQRQVLLHLPTETPRMELLLGSLGSLSRSTVPGDALSGMLLRTAEQVRTGELVQDALPVHSVNLGPGRADRLEFTAAEGQMRRYFSLARLEPGPDSPVRVLVLNGTARPGLAATARGPLESAGLVMVTGGNEPKPGAITSVITVPSNVPGAAAWGSRIAAALRLPASSVTMAPVELTTADATVVLGADYRPATAVSPDPSLSPEATPTFSPAPTPSPTA